VWFTAAGSGPESGSPRAAGVEVQRVETAAIAYANKPGKDRALRSFDPDALITSVDEITAAA